MRAPAPAYALAGNTIQGDVILEDTATECSVSGNHVAGEVTDKGVRNVVSQRSAGRAPVCTIDPRLFVTTSAWTTANQAVYLRVTGRGYITKIGLHIGAASGNICVGVFAGNNTDGRGARPSARKVTSGSVACPAAGYAEVALTAPVYVQEGDWLAIAVDNTTAAIGRATANGFTSAVGNGSSCFQNGAFPLPSSATPTSGALFSQILVGVE